MIISTPAKIILSGEHSVIYGAPAIGAPLSLFLYSRWSTAEGKAITVTLNERQVIIAQSWSEFPAHLDTYRARYQAYRNGDISIANVLPGPLDLVTLVFAAFHDKVKANMPGLSLSLQTEIPVSSGLGSSSSLIYNLLRGLLSLSGRDMPLPELLDFARGIEDFQHGISSGIDLALVSAKQPLVFMKDKGVIETMPPVPSGIVLVHSGKPSVSTGQCVAQVREKFMNDNIWTDFAACTRGIQAAFASEDASALSDGIFENQRLLDHIGVVPDKVRSFVTACRDQGIAAKVCGAGAVAGEGAGMLWALADDDAAMRALQQTAQSFGYTHGLYSVAS